MYTHTNRRVKERDALVFVPGDRRGAVRFPIKRCVRYRFHAGAIGHGRTINISRKGVLFTADDPPVVGEAVKLMVEWPAKLGEEIPSELVILGRIVRREPDRAAVTIEKYEIRTPGSRRPILNV